MKKPRMVCFSLMAFLVGGFWVAGWVGNASGWWVIGHSRIAEAAATRLPADIPEFFRNAGPALGQMAGDPDRWKNPGAKHLRATEGPEHFLDLEDLGGQDLPLDRFQAIQMLIKLGRKPERVGLLPYSVLEGYEKLACCFQDYREAPEDKVRQWRCLVYGATLAHYAGDCAMPLHTTRDYDGRIRDGQPPLQKGIHARLDAFPEKHGLTVAEMSKDWEVIPTEDAWERFLTEFRASHRLVDEAYELDSKGLFQEPNGDSKTFVLGRCRAAAKFTADLWAGAWKKSATLPKPY